MQDDGGGSGRVREERMKMRGYLRLLNTQIHMQRATYVSDADIRWRRSVGTLAREGGMAENVAGLAKQRQLPQDQCVQRGRGEVRRLTYSQAGRCLPAAAPFSSCLSRSTHASSLSTCPALVRPTMKASAAAIFTSFTSPSLSPSLGSAGSAGKCTGSNAISAVEQGTTRSPSTVRTCAGFCWARARDLSSILRAKSPRPCHQAYALPPAVSAVPESQPARVRIRTVTAACLCESYLLAGSPSYRECCRRKRARRDAAPRPRRRNARYAMPSQRRGRALYRTYMGREVPEHRRGVMMTHETY